MAEDRTAITAELEIDGTPMRPYVLRLRDALFGVPHLSAEISDPSGDCPDPKPLLGKPLVATLLPERGDGPIRVFHGIVVAARRSEDGLEATRLVVEAAPALWKLGKRSDCRVYQDQSVVDVAQDVLSRAGVTDVELLLTGSYEPTLYRVQYRETDLAFFERILSEAGIYYFVRYEAGKDTVVLCDDPAGAGVIEGESVLLFDPVFGDERARPSVRHLKKRLSICTDKVTLRDYDFERPRYTLEASVEGTDEGEKSLELYGYPARFLDDAAGQHYAQVLLDALQAERDVLTGESNALTLFVGHRFEVDGHPLGPLNQEYMLIAVEVDWVAPRGARSRRATDEQIGQRVRFSAIPTGRSPYRPPRKARAQSIPGAQSGIVTGPAGAEIHSDEHGRVKVKYPWDRVGKEDDTSSLWVRTSQLPTEGAMLLPRMGWEVLVHHAEGDPDTPLVMARLYNTVTPPPYALPEGKARSALQTATTPGGGSVNELRTDDTKGSEEMFFNASKDMTIKVLNNTTEYVGNDETHDVAGNQELSVTNSLERMTGASQTVDVGGNQDTKIETFKVDQCGGDHALTVAGNLDMKVGGDHKRTVDGSSTVDVGAICTDVVVGSVNEAVLGDMTLDVGAARVTMTAGDHSTAVGGAHSETVTAVKVIIGFGGRGVEVGGAMTQQIGGALLTKIDGDRADSAGATFTEVAAGASIIKADNVTYEATGMISVVMGASTLMVTPAAVMLAGVSIKLDGAAKDTAALILDN